MAFSIFLFFISILGPFRVSALQQKPIISLSSESGKGASISNAINNAPHIFNTINGAMRQWGPSLKHNGMSFFPVTIPENTILYHGSLSNSTLNEIAWMAFEIDHAELFTGPFPYTPGGISIIPPPKTYNKEPKLGYIASYRTTRPLRNVIYLDGQSAAKSTMGTLDTQDKLLLKDINFRDLPGFQDYNRAASICSLWPHLDGILRMEVGFEIIMCHSLENLKLASQTSLPRRWSPEKIDEDTFWNAEFMRSVSLGYHGVVGGKVIIDYSSMVSAYFYPLNLSNPDPQMAPLPRLPSNDTAGLDTLRKDVLAMFDGREKVQSKIDWQAITDSIVSRYSDRLAYMKSIKSSRIQMIYETNVLLKRFIDHTKQDLIAAHELCTLEFLLPVEQRPTILADEMIFEAITTVTGKICGVLLEARKKLLEREDPNVADEVKIVIGDLMKWLDWSSWLECGKCDWNEVCVVAIWPWGTKENHDHPRCYDLSEAWGGLGYWDYDLGPTDQFKED